jgi:hypothetical protein
VKTKNSNADRVCFGGAARDASSSLNIHEEALSALALLQKGRRSFLEKS